MIDEIFDVFSKGKTSRYDRERIDTMIDRWERLPFMVEKYPQRADHSKKDDELSKDIDTKCSWDDHIETEKSYDSSEYVPSRILQEKDKHEELKKLF